MTLTIGENIGDTNIAATMSGLEAVGLILGVIPLIIAGVGQCKDNLAGKEMRQLERHFKTQHNIFLNNIEELLSTLVSDTHLEQLMKDPHGEAWRDKAVSAKLEEQLGGAYQSFEEIMEDVKVMMEDLRERLTTDVRYRLMKLYILSPY